ncbi:hypothetical protein RGO69_004119 [Morganella morganii]|nr:hypothetical protein [Morganella morganii]
MGSERRMQDTQADKLDQLNEEIYKTGFMDGYGEGYHDAIEDTEQKLNDLENKLELLSEHAEKESRLLDETLSLMGQGLSKGKGR